MFGIEKEYESELKELVSRSGLEEQVIFAGHQQQVEGFISASDAVVHSSMFEPFGMVVVEAMAAGRPVLAVNNGGPAEIIRHGVDGYLYDGSSGELAHYMAQVYGDRNLTLRVGDEAKKTIDSRFTARIMADRFTHVVEERMANG
ncbi:putative glycosyltransferase EpsD [compost metagenome]